MTCSAAAPFPRELQTTTSGARPRYAGGARGARHLFVVRERPAAEGSTAASTDPGDLDALEELADEIATLFAHVHAATYRLLELIREFDRRRGWEPGGYRSCADWLAFRTGIDLGAAREKVRAAWALERLPKVSEAMAKGELSFSKVRAITRVAEPETEGELLEYARATTAARLERLIRGWRLAGRLEEAELERRRHASRRLSVFPDDDGMYEVRGRLDPEVGALLMRAIEAASDALYRSEAREGEACCGVELPDAAQRRADAIGLLAERALAAGFGGEEDVSADGRRGRLCRPRGTAPAGARRVSAETPEMEQPAARDGATTGAARRVSAETPERGPASMPDKEPAGRRPDATRVVARVSAETPARRSAARERPLHFSGTRAERYQVLVHVDAATLALEGEAARSELEDGTRLSAETARRLACDAAIVRVVRGPGGAVLDVGRKTRTVTPAIRRALRVRDGGCRFPGCGVRFTDAHHVVHWADGGSTSLAQTISLCRFHHRLVHEGGFSVTLGAKGHVLFWNREGRPVAAAPPRPSTRPVRGVAVGSDSAPLPADPLDPLLRSCAERGVTPDGFTAGARYRRDVDIPYRIEARAQEAVCAVSTSSRSSASAASRFGALPQSSVQRCR